MAKDTRSDRDLEIAWLRDHGPYQVRTLRYALKRMKEVKTDLEYDVHFEAFIVQLRNLTDFFTDPTPPQSDFCAKHFHPTWKKPEKKVRDQLVAASQMNLDVFHPGKKRAAVQGDKILFGKCEKAALVIEGFLEEWLQDMPEGNRKLWNDERANRLDPKPLPVELVGGASGASSSISTTTSMFMGTGPTPTAEDLAPKGIGPKGPDGK